MANFPFDLVSPERLVLSVPVREVVVPGSDGDFTVLPGHAPFLAALRPGVLSVMDDAGGEVQRFYVRGGFADVGAHGLTILAERACKLDELDEQDIAREVDLAEKGVTSAMGEDAAQAARERLSRIRELQTDLAR